MQKHTDLFWPIYWLISFFNKVEFIFIFRAVSFFLISFVAF